MPGEKTALQRIVVGIDGSENAKAALKWALAEAKLRKAILQPTMVWSYPYYALPPDAMVLSETFETVEQRERELFEGLVHEVVDQKDPDIVVQPLLIEGQTARSSLAGPREQTYSFSGLEAAGASRRSCSAR